MKEKFLEATKNILKKNLEIEKSPFCNNKIVLIYDKNSKLSILLWEAYEQNLKNNSNAEIIVFSDMTNAQELQNFLLSLTKDSTVILVQSTNFRIENFRIRMSLFRNGVWCLEHNHLGYIRENEIENYADVIEYKTPYYKKLSEKLKKISDWAKSLKIVSKDRNIIEFLWGLEDMKQNTGDYTWKNRWGSFPIGENFTEIKDFAQANGIISIRAYPNEKLLVEHVEPFTLEIKGSLVVGYWENAPEYFKEIIEKIKKSEDWEVYLRELWFWLNKGISWKKHLSDVNAFERIAGFHMSLWKKHGIYRKKFHRKITQRFHIDIFSDTDYIEFDGKRIFEKEQFII